MRTGRPYSVRPSAVHIVLVRPARRIHHDYKKQKQSIKDEEKNIRGFHLLEMSLLNIFADSNIVLLYLDQTPCSLIQFQ